MLNLRIKKKKILKLKEHCTCYKLPEISKNSNSNFGIPKQNEKIYVKRYTFKDAPNCRPSNWMVIEKKYKKSPGKHR